MGLFSKRAAEPVAHEPVVRAVFVAASADAVIGHLGAYSTLFASKRSIPQQLMVAMAAGWTIVRLPDAVHPWQLHNLAQWMIDCPGGGAVVARSEASSTHPGYSLVPDPEVSDSFCGWADDGQPWTVQVPANDIVRGEAVPVGAPAIPSLAQLVAGDATAWRPVDVHLDDPGADMNPTNASNMPNRRQLANRYGGY